MFNISQNHTRFRSNGKKYMLSAIKNGNGSDCFNIEIRGIELRFRRKILKARLYKQDCQHFSTKKCTNKVYTVHIPMVYITAARYIEKIFIFFSLKTSLLTGLLFFRLRLIYLTSDLLMFALKFIQKFQ